MIHLQTHLTKRNEEVNEVDDSFEYTFIKEKWKCEWSSWFIWTHTYQRETKSVNEVGDSFEHSFIKEKWRCKCSRSIHFKTHLSKRNEDENEVDDIIWRPHIYQREMQM